MSATHVRSTGFSRQFQVPAKAGTTNARRIVLHADDFGMSRAVTDGILRGFGEGLLTSTSLLSNAPDAARALDCWGKLESRRIEGGKGELKSASRRKRLGDLARPFDLGIHLNLTQGRPLIGSRFPAGLLDREGRFPGIFGLFRRLRRGGQSTIERIEEELTAQVQFMLDRGHRPSHLNGHQYIELLPALAGIVELLVERFRIPAVRVAWERSWRKSFAWPGVRASQWLLGGVKKYFAGRFRLKILGHSTCSPDAFFGTMTAGTTSVGTIGAYLSASHDIPLTEIGLHPALKAEAQDDHADGWHDPLAALRPQELEMIVSAELGELLAAHGCRLGRLVS